MGSSFYQLPDGGEVEVTNVERTLEDSGIFQWPDRVEVGPVTKYLRKGRIGALENKFDFYDNDNDAEAELCKRCSLAKDI